MAALIHLSSHAPKKKVGGGTSSGGRGGAGIRIPAWAFARRCRISDRSDVAKKWKHTKDELKLQGSPDSLAKRTVETVPTSLAPEEEDRLLIPRMNKSHQDQQHKQKTHEEEEGQDAFSDLDSNASSRKAVAMTPPRIIFKMDVTGFEARNLRVDIDTCKKHLNLLGMGPRMFKRTFPLPPAMIDSKEDLLCTQAVMTMERERTFLVVRTVANNNAKSHVENQENDDDDSSVSTCGGGLRHLPIEDETRPPMLITIPGTLY